MGTIKLTTASSGNVILSPANTASDVTITVPAQTGTVVATDSSGNVGIGTTSPGGGANDRILNIQGSTSSQILVKSGSVQMQNWAFSGSGAYTVTTGANAYYFGTTDAYPVIYQTNNTERMRLDSSGNLLVGCTASPSSSVVGWKVAKSGDQGYMASSAGSSSTREHWYLYNTNGLVGSVSTSGSSTTYATSSDYRLKENVSRMTGALAKVSQLKPVTYTWKADGSEGQGFIAHELQAVVPDCVTGEKDAVDVDGNPVYQGIDTSFLVATLTAAIQELKAELDTVKTELATLKGQA